MTSQVGVVETGEAKKRVFSCVKHHYFSFTRSFICYVFTSWFSSIEVFAEREARICVLVAEVLETEAEVEWFESARGEVPKLPVLSVLPRAWLRDTVVPERMKAFVL